MHCIELLKVYKTFEKVFMQVFNHNNKLLYVEKSLSPFLKSRKVLYLSKVIGINSSWSILNLFTCALFGNYLTLGKCFINFNILILAKLHHDQNVNLSNAL